MSGSEARSDDAVRREASDWVALVHDADAAVDRAAFERWRMADPRHAAAYARAELAWDHAALLAQTSFGRARGLPERLPWYARTDVRYALVAAAALLLGLFAVVLTIGPSFGRFAEAAPIQLASRVGEIRRVALEDGSVVILDTDTVLRVAFSHGERRLFLSHGRARFDVAHDAARPFIVLAGGRSVTARGTMFDVSVDGGGVKVMLLRGLVDVRSIAGQTRATSVPPVIRLRPGQQLAMGDAGTVPAPRPIALAEQQWPSGMLTFNGARLRDAVADANRYSLSKISVADPTLDDLRITGAYHVGDAGGLAASLAASLGLQAARTERGDFLISRPPGASLK